MESYWNLFLKNYKEYSYTMNVCLCVQNNTWKRDKYTMIFTVILFELNKFQFIQLFQFDQFVKDIGLCGIAAFIRPVFLESQKIHLTIWGNESLVVLKGCLPHSRRKNDNENTPKPATSIDSHGSWRRAEEFLFIPMFFAFSCWKTRPSLVT